jgi:hypothetical protein
LISAMSFWVAHCSSDLAMGDTAMAAARALSSDAPADTRAP